MMSARTRAFGALLVGALLVGGATACQSDGKKTSDAKGTAAQKSAQPALTPVAAVRQAATAASKLKSIQYTMSGRVGTQKNFEADASLAMDPLTMQMTMKTAQTGSEQVTIRLVGGVMYIDGGQDAAAQMNGKRWIRFDPKELAKAQGSSGGGDPLASLGQQTNQNPSTGVGLLGRSSDVKKVGQETVRGVRTTHYTGTINLASLSSGTSVTGTQSKQALAEFKKLGVGNLTVDLWTGPDNRVVQVRERASSDAGPLDVTMQVTGINKKVTIVAPPASETLDLAQMMKQASKG